MPRDPELEKRVQQLSPQERYTLRMLQKKLKGPQITAGNVAKILPEAIQQSESEHRNLSKSIVEVTERAIDNSVSRDPEVLSTALFPIIGAAIRKAMNKLLSDMMNQLNSGLEKTFSFKRIGWRFEAWKTGVPFIEIVLRNTLDYRVEQVFLIHKKTGLLLNSLSHSEAKAADSDMVASMLTAIKDYIHDSLSLEESSIVQGISAGDHSVLTEEGPLAIIAVIVRGTPDKEVREAMETAVENVHARYSSVLRNFSGETAPFEEQPELIRPCLLSRKSGGSDQKPIYAIGALIILILMLLGLGSIAVLDELDRRAFIRSLKSEPGIVVSAAERGIINTRLSLLRDKRAREITTIAEEQQVILERFRIETGEFISPDFGPVYFEGPSETDDTLSSLIEQISSVILLFETNSSDLSPGQRDLLYQAGRDIDELLAITETSGVDTLIEIIGHAAGDVQDNLAMEVSRDRAVRVAELLGEDNPLRLSRLRPRGVGTNEPLNHPGETANRSALNRSTTFKLIFE